MERKHESMAEEELGDSVLMQLRHSLQLLAAPAQDQLAHFDPLPFPICKADEMALEYDHWATSVPTYWTLSPDQAEHLLVLNDFLESISGQTHSDLWTDEALCTDPHWEDVRRLAKRALLSFHWSLDIPPPEQHPERYVPSRSVEHPSKG